jgi:hypothetical protein
LAAVGYTTVMESYGVRAALGDDLGGGFLALGAALPILLAAFEPL